MACSEDLLFAKNLQARAFSEKRLARSLSYPLPASVMSFNLFPIYKPVENPVGKRLQESPPPIGGTCKILALKKQNFGSAVTSSLLYVGKRNVQFKEKKGLRVSASGAPFRGEEAMLTAGGTGFSKRDVQAAIGAAITVVLAVANRVLYKMALVPLKDYPFFLALTNTFGYVLVYLSILYVRYRKGIVTDEMLELPKSRFILVGALEALGLASGMAAAVVLPGALIPILTQSFLVWQLVLSMTFLKKRYSFGQIVGCAMVLAGVVIALASSGSGLASSADQIGIFWPLLMIFSAAFQASASIIKEFIFRDAAERLKGGSVDIFIVNSFGSSFQAIFVLVMLPFLSQLRGIPFSQLPGYIKDGAGCLFNVGSVSADCNGATLLAFAYVAVNLAFNISLLSLLKMSSAVVSSLCVTLAVPLSIYIFTLPLPYVGVPASLPPTFLFGAVILLGGLAFYNFFGHFKKFLKRD